jgi:AraC-like DNA-binding protein
MESGPVRLEMVRRRPAEPLFSYVREYCGYAETAPGMLRRREYPGPQAVVVFEFGPPLRLFDPASGRALRHQGGFVAGIDDRYADTEHDGFQSGLQVNFTPIGARRFFGMPMAELTGRVFALNDVFDLEARRFAMRLHEAGDWEARFDLLDRFIAARMARPGTDSRVAEWAFDRIAALGGRIDVAGLARESGYSQKHLITLFRDFVGVPPKLLARIIRFDGVMQRLRSGRAGTWADLAAELGYYDQAHLVRDFRQFTGTTPTDVRGQVATLLESIA